ncbi:hypothetical protein [Myxococcus sp. AM010]|uniref:hypothetical protein n=1 Tax=Myxococcus sp. AM010 TaxID=2745138 RepID=UPI0020D1D9C8|nr:hypothetical protein [Myxococcus sp. AM010]
MTSAHTWRFELYHQVNRGDPNAGNDVHVGSDGKRYGMGREDYRPFVERCELIPPEGFEPLSAELGFLPYFGEQKPATTLGAYFKAQSIRGSTLQKLLPRDLEGLLRTPKDDRQYFSTRVEPTSQARRLVVIWNPEGQWYVDEVFYRIEGLGGWQRGACADVVEGTFSDFLQYSPLLAPRLSEGFSQLEHPERRQQRFSKDALVLRLQKTPGMPNTRSFWLEVFADGRFKRNGPLLSEVNADDAHRLTTLLIAASRLSELKEGRSAPPPPAHDGQETTLEFTVNGRRTRLTLGNDTPPFMLRFMKQVATAYGLEL